MTVQPEEYMSKTVEHCQFLNRFVARVVESNQTWAAEDSFVLVKPKLTVKVTPIQFQPKLGRECKIAITLANPLNVELTGCFLAVEGPGFIAATKRSVR